MTVGEFKKAKPELAHLEGNDLLNAMEDYFLRLQDGYKLTKKVLPFWKRYTFRWLFYRKVKNWVFQKSNYTASKRCSICKKPTGMLFLLGGKMWCSGHEYKEEPNTSLAHRLWVIWNILSKSFWAALDWLHIVRSSIEGRYGMMGDEACYVKQWSMSWDTGKTTHTLKPRKWWQYIFVERKFHPKF